MKGAPKTKSTIFEECCAILASVDEVAKQLEDKWGWGRLPTLVEPKWAAKLVRARHAFNDAQKEWDVDLAQRKGDALIRGYRKLDQLATEAGHKPAPPEQWEFEGPDGPVILVKDRRDVGRAERHGRQCQVWALDEIEGIISKTPKVIERAKSHFMGAVVESIRPGSKSKDPLDDPIADIFA
jgi:hypothetical protein